MSVKRSFRVSIDIGGTFTDIVAMGPKGALVMRSDRRSILPSGLAGTPAWNVINPGAAQRLLPVCPVESVLMVQGDEFLQIQAGAGGHGDRLLGQSV